MLTKQLKMKGTRTFEKKKQQPEKQRNKRNRNTMTT
jgi:hypothetical protein